MEVGGYSLHLYCDQTLPICYVGGSHQPVPDGYHEYGEFPHEFVGQTGAECKKMARDKGWTFHRDGKHSCPRCSI